VLTTKAPSALLRADGARNRSPRLTSANTTIEAPFPAAQRESEASACSGRECAHDPEPHR